MEVRPAVVRSSERKRTVRAEERRECLTLEEREIGREDVGARARCLHSEPRWERLKATIHGRVELGGDGARQVYVLRFRYQRLVVRSAPMRSDSISYLNGIKRMGNVVRLGRRREGRPHFGRKITGCQAFLK